MGVKMSNQKTIDNPYTKALHDLLNVIVRRFLSLFKRFDLTFMLTKDYQIQRRAVKIIHQYDKSIIDKRMKIINEEKLNNKNSFDNNNDEIGVRKKKVFLDILLEARSNEQSISDEEILNEVDTFMFGVGTE